MPVNRRRFLQAAGTASAIGLTGCTTVGQITGVGGGASDGIVIGTLTPLSGSFARDGTLVKKGVDYAVSEINSNGGIEALDGSKLSVVSEDTGSSVSSATSAAQRLYSFNNPVATVGSWLSSQTLATTAVSERNQVPQLTLSYSDKIVQRGYRYTFQTSPLSSELGKQSLNLAMSLSEAVGNPINEVALVGDNTAATALAFGPLRSTYIPEQQGVKLVVDKTWTPTLSNPTPVVRALEQQQPDMMFFGATAFPDSLAILRKMNELNVQLPTIGVGAWLTLPSYVSNIGAGLTQGLMAITGSHPLEGQKDIIRNFSKFANEPFMIQDSVQGYAHTYIVKEALERSGSTDPTEIRDTISNISLTKGAAVQSFPIDRIEFNSNGHMTNAQAVLSQWQSADVNWIGTPAAPFAAFPEEYAMREVEWTPADYN